MELNQLFGLPAHPLVVHAAVVLLPLAAIATVVLAFLPRYRRTYGPIVIGLAAFATLAVGLAQGSGEELQHKVDRTQLVEEHTEQGEIVLPWAIALTVASIVVVGAPELLERRPQLPGRAITGAALVFALIAASGATYTVIDVGHSGAKATWNEVGSGSG